MTELTTQSSANRRSLMDLPDELLIQTLENVTHKQLRTSALTCKRMWNVVDTVFRNKARRLGYGEPTSVPSMQWLFRGAKSRYLFSSSMIPWEWPLHGPRNEEEREDLQDYGVETHRLFRHGTMDRRDMYGRAVTPEVDSDCSIASLFQPHHLQSSTCPFKPDEDNDPGHLTYRTAFEFAVFPQVRSLDLLFVWDGAVSDPVQVVNEKGVTVWDTLETIHEARVSVINPMGIPEDGTLIQLVDESAAPHPLRNWWIAHVGTDLEDPMVKAEVECEVDGGILRFDGTDAATLTWSMRRVEFEEEP